ncbi:hypothetical protein Bca101_013489 [Brassica carinata]
MFSYQSARLYLKQRLYAYRMNESMSIESNIDDFLRIITDLGNVMVEVSDEDQAILLLMSLPKQFDQLRDTLSVNGNGNKNHGEVLYSNSQSRGRSPKRDSYQCKFKDKSLSKSKGKGNRLTVGCVVGMDISR